MPAHTGIRDLFRTTQPNSPYLLSEDGPYDDWTHDGMLLSHAGRQLYYFI